MIPADATAAAHQELYRRLLDGDAVAPSDLAEAFLDQLAAELQRYNPQIDPHLCTEAAEDAILALIKNPRSYNPARGIALLGYLRMSAKGDLQNRQRKERRHADRRAGLEAVELAPAAGKCLQDGEADPLQILVRWEEIEEMIATIPAVPAVVLDGLTEQERTVLELMRRGERRTAAYARALCIVDLPFTEQQRRAKQVKDRLQKRLQRAGYGRERQT
jgi:sigma-70-like protein